jgi:transposase
MKKACIVRDKAAGMTNTEIAKKFRVHCTTVTSIHNRYSKTEDYYAIKHKSGHPRKFLTHDAQYAVRMLASTDSHDVADLQRKYFPDINAETI